MEIITIQYIVPYMYDESVTNDRLLYLDITLHSNFHVYLLQLFSCASISQSHTCTWSYHNKWWKLFAITVMYLSFTTHIQTKSKKRENIATNQLSHMLFNLCTYFNNSNILVWILKATTGWTHRMDGPKHTK